MGKPDVTNRRKRVRLCRRKLHPLSGGSCQECAREAARKKYRRNADEYKRRAKEWREANPERFRELVKAWKEEHPDYQRNRYLRQNPDARRYGKDSKHPFYSRLRSYIRRAKRFKVPFEEITVDQLKALFYEQGGSCAYCKAPLEGTAELDHKLPMHRGGPHRISNLVWSCQTCNRKKRHRTPDEYENARLREEALRYGDLIAPKTAPKATRKALSRVAAMITSEEPAENAPHVLHA